MNLSRRPMLGQASTTRFLDTAVDDFLANRDRLHDLENIDIYGQGPKKEKLPWWLLIAIPAGLFLVVK